MISGRLVRGWTAAGRAWWVLRWPAVLSALVFALAAPGASFGQTIWNNAGTGNWNTPANWTLGVPNSASGTAFDAQIKNGGTAQLSAPGASVRRMRVGVFAGGGHLEVNGGGLTITDDLILNFAGTSPASMTVQLGGIVTVPATIVGESSTGFAGFKITGAGSRVNSTSSFEVGLEGNGALILADGGTLAVGSGGTQPLKIATKVGSLGTVSIGLNGGAAGMLQASEVRFGAGTGFLQFSHVGNLTFATQITGPGSVSAFGPGTTTLSGTNSYTGVTYIRGGTLVVSADANLGTAPGAYIPNQIEFEGGRLRATESFTMAATRGIDAFGGGTIEVDATKTLTLSSNLSVDSGSMTKTGAGALSVPNLTVEAELLVTGGGTLATTFDGAVGPSAGEGIATVRGAGSTLSLGGGLTVGSSNYGALNIEDQALVHALSISIGAKGIVNLSGGTLRFNDYSRAASGTFNFNSGTIQLAGNRSVGTDAAIADLFGAIPAIPTGKGLTVEGTATLSKPLTIDGGTFKGNSLDIGVGGALDFDRGLLELTGGTITGLASLTVPTGGEFRAGGVQSLRITGAAGSTITATGNLTLGNAAAVNGFGTQGTLQVGANTVTLLDANDVVFDSLALATLGNAGSPGTLNAANGLTIDFGGNFTGFGAVSTPNNVAKPLINNGHITGNSASQRITLPGYVKGVGTFDNVIFTGTFSPGLSSASLIVGNIAFSPSSTLVMELGDPAPGTGHDQLQSSGALAFDGTLLVSLINGFSPVAGQSFNLFDWISTSGAFDTLNLPTLVGLAWNTSQLYTTGVLSLAAAGLPGDYNQNGVVDAADYVVWRNNLGSGTSLANDDTAGVGPDDYTRWRAHFGNSAGSGAAAVPASSPNAAVPEPATWAMMLGALCLLGFGTVGRRRTPAAPAYRLLLCHAPRVVLFAALAITSPHLSGSASGNSTWTNTGLGNWYIAGNWSAGVPDSDDDAFIPAGTALVSSLGAFSRDLRLGHTGGNGSLLISNGGTLDSLRNFLADGSGSNVSATVSGGTSFWSHFDLFVGVRGTGSLTVSNGGLVHSIIGSGNIGFYTGSTGSVNVTGANSAWIADGNIHVGGPGTAADGFNGVGTLQIASGGLIQASNLIVFDTGSVQVNNGSSTVSGLTVSGLSGYALGSPFGPLTVGNTASGRMVVQTRGTVWSSLGTIGANSGTIGSVLVQGANTSWTNTDQVSVGHNGTGTLEVRNGGTLTSARGFAGAGAFSTGWITVSDPGSTWTASGSFFIGNSGSGLLEVLNGGVASTTGNCHLGITVGATGDVNVSGPGSTLNIAVLLNIGGDSNVAQGAGSVRIADGGIVNVGAATNLYSTGRLDLVNATTFTGDVNSFGGLIRTIGNTTLANAIHLNAGGVFVDNLTTGSKSNFSGNIDGPGGLTKSGISGFTGRGTLILTGTNTYLGPTTVNSGTLLVDGSITSATTVNTGATLGGVGTVGAVIVNNGGFVSPGNSPGPLTAAAVTFGSGAPTLAIELGGTTPGMQYDQLFVTGNLSLGGALAVSLIDSFAPVAGQAFNILNWGSLSGMFASMNLPTLVAGLSWNTLQLYATGVLSVGLAGDYNNNGVVDAADYVVWRKGLGTIFTQTDYDVWRANFGATVADSGATANSSANTASNVPEPVSLMLLMIGCAAIGLIKQSR